MLFNGREITPQEYREIIRNEDLRAEVYGLQLAIAENQSTLLDRLSAMTIAAPKRRSIGNGRKARAVRAWLKDNPDSGLSLSQMADAITAKTGVMVTRQYVGMIINEKGSK